MEDCQQMAVGLLCKYRLVKQCTLAVASSLSQHHNSFLCTVVCLTQWYDHNFNYPKWSVLQQCTILKQRVPVLMLTSWWYVRIWPELQDAKIYTTNNQVSFNWWFYSRLQKSCSMERLFNKPTIEQYFLYKYDYCVKQWPRHLEALQSLTAPQHIPVTCDGIWCTRRNS